MTDVTLTREEYNQLLAERDRARSIAVNLESECARLLDTVRQMQTLAFDITLVASHSIIKGEVE